MAKQLGPHLSSQLYGRHEVGGHGPGLLGQKIWEPIWELKQKKDAV
jgi:hypothetical protein